ncbi:phospholipase C accessory protein PlcR [Pseudomonas edaphica]|uniref:Phospholipase C accessory protein PlcR n=1 Tax=Pseudomonas edaphica TaxID=2006980 RepID=A0ABY2U752_9PSED|nr:phospholipase C accessory protein PlcR [Pseudomonas edaphica]TLG91591.1 phospholipase C accessory protein PlcR [Pseudomonas edaphica]
MIDAQTLSSLAQRIGAFSQTAESLPEPERKQTAMHLIEAIENVVAQGADLHAAYEYAQQLTMHIESSSSSLEALNYQVWRKLKDNYTPPPAPTAAQREQIEIYSKASEQIIDEVLSSTEGEEAQHVLIEEKLSTLRKQVFGIEEPQFLLQ